MKYFFFKTISPDENSISHHVKVNTRENKIKKEYFIKINNLRNLFKIELESTIRVDNFAKVKSQVKDCRTRKVCHNRCSVNIADIIIGISPISHFHYDEFMSSTPL